MLENMLLPQYVHTEVELPEWTKVAALSAAAHFGADKEVDAKTLKEAFIAREKEYSTGFGGGIALPHAKIKGITHPRVLIVRYAQPTDWDAIDDKPVIIAICLVMPEKDKDNTHLQVISKLARKLADEDFVARLIATQDPIGLYQLIINNMEG